MAWAVVSLAALVLLSLADHRGLLLGHGDDWARYHGRTFRVTRVVDGDTLHLDAPDADKPTTRVRLWGIDTPEVARPDQNREAEPFAERASELTRSLTLDRQVTLLLEPHRQRGRYGRLLAHVQLEDGTVLNERLIEAGMARNDDRFSHSHNERYALLESQAKHDGVGLWQK